MEKESNMNQIPFIPKNWVLIMHYDIITENNTAPC